jgi:phosphoribosylamine--glycine ligase
MKVLVVGSGAREHALCWKLAREGAVRHVLCAPGNPGIAGVATLASVAPTDLDGLVGLARGEGVDLTVVGPELPLAAGIADRFAAEGLRLLGPTQSAARLETSKAFAKAFMARHGVPTGRFRTCASIGEARAAIDEFGAPVVVKADGLAAGKGVVVADTHAAAVAAATAALVTREFGDAGSTVVIEECLVGQEASFFCLCDGRHALPMGTAQDHKRVFDDDRGPNTGGMGAFAPSPLVDPAVHARVVDAIVSPVLAGLHDEGAPFRGFLYVGLMLTREGPQVIEFNVRFGDPEAQVVLPLVDDDLAPLLAAAADGQLGSGRCSLGQGARVGVVLASGGYPGRFARGKRITGVDEAAALDGVLLFHAGTALRDGHLVTDGGRVLTVVGAGADYRAAIARAYEASSHVAFDGMHLRRDIGKKALGPPGPAGPID